MKDRLSKVKNKFLVLLAMLTIVGANVVPSTIAMAESFDNTEQVDSSSEVEEKKITEESTESSSKVNESTTIESTQNTQKELDKTIGESMNSNDSPIDSTTNSSEATDTEATSTTEVTEETQEKVERTGEELANRDNPTDVQGLTDNEIISLAKYLYGDYAKKDSSFGMSVKNDKGESIEIPFERRTRFARSVGTEGNPVYAIYDVSKGAWSAWGDFYQPLYIDGKLAYCVEPGVVFVPGAGFTQQTTFNGMTPIQREAINTVMNFGAKKGDSGEYIFATNMYIWEKLGWSVSTSLPGYANYKQQIENNIANFRIKPSFHKKTYNVKVGETLRITDTHGVLNNFSIKNNLNAKVEKKGNVLEITPNANSKNGDLDLFRNTFYTDSQLFWVKPGSQAVSTGGVGDPTVSFVKINVIKNGNAQVKKIDKATGKTLAGAVFKFTNLSTKETKEITSNSRGIAQWNDILAATQVKIEEIKAPNGYVLTKETKTVTIEPSKTISVTLDNKEQLANLKILKEDSETGNKPQGAATLDGAVYGLYDSAGKEVKKVTLTEKDGVVQGEIKGLKLGKYTLKELEAPEGYVLDPKEHAVELAYAGQNLEIALKETTVKDRVIKGNIEGYKFGSRELIPSLLDPMNILKKGSTSQRPPLKDVELTATSKTTGQKYVTKTDEKGYFKFANLPYDTYHIEETQGLDGYKLIEPFDVIVNSDGKTYFYLLEDELITSKLRVFKYDGETKEPLAGAKFKIFDTWANDGKGAFIEMTAPNSTEVTDTFETGKNGEMVLTETLPWGENRYELHEVEAPEGYLPLEKPIIFSVTGEEVGGMVSIEVPNMFARQDVELVKVDEMSQKPLENVPFQLIKKEKDGTETVIDTYKTDKSGKISIKALGYGRYIFREIEPLENYYPLDKDIPFEVTVEHNGEKIELRAENKRKPLVITTVLATVDGKKEINPQVDNILRDKVMVQRAEKGHTYYVDSFYVDPKTKKELAKDQSTYTAKNESDTFFVDFKLQKDTMKDGQKGVATHYIYYDKEKTKLVEKETDLNNPDQTVVAKAPIVPADKNIPVLPKTGEQKGILFTILGFILLSGAAYLVTTKRKQNN